MRWYEREVAAGPTPLTLVMIWSGAVAVLGLLFVIGEASIRGGDDVDPARQRPGILDLGELPLAAPELAPGVPARGQPSVVFFVGRNRPALCRELAGRRWLPASTQVYVVTDQRRDGCGGTSVGLVEHSVARAAMAYGLARPRDGGAPLGYAIVDSIGRIRYRTLDPVADSLMAEVDTMLAAL